MRFSHSWKDFCECFCGKHGLHSNVLANRLIRLLRFSTLLPLIFDLRSPRRERLCLTMDNVSCVWSPCERGDRWMSHFVCHVTSRAASTTHPIHPWISRKGECRNHTPSHRPFRGRSQDLSPIPSRNLERVRTWTLRLIRIPSRT